MCVLYTPYPYAIAIAYIHFVLFLAMLFLKFKSTTDNEQIRLKLCYYLYAVCQFINLMLIVGGLVGMGYGKKSFVEDY